MKRKTKYQFLLIITTVLFAMGYQLKIKANNPDLATTNRELIYHKSDTDPDKNLLIGEWSQTETRNLIKITETLEIGKLELEVYNPTKIEIEKANWSKTGNLLSVYIELQNENLTRSNYKLNYIPQRDVLVGEYFQATDSTRYSVEFIRIK
ncbi:MAG: hypothetical protein ACI7YS_06545 [Flavobacterium sp.]